MHPYRTNNVAPSDEPDFFAEIDRRLPPWTQQETIEWEGHSGLTPDNQGCGVRTVIVSFEMTPELDGTEERKQVRGEVVIPYQPYLRAIDPVGNLVPLIVSTNREFDGDAQAYRDRIVAAKMRKGWLIAEPVPNYIPAACAVHDERGNLVTNEYGRYLFETAKERKAAHAARMLDDEERQRSIRERKAEAAQEKFTTALERQGSNLELLVQRLAEQNEDFKQILLAALSAPKKGKAAEQ